MLSQELDDILLQEYARAYLHDLFAFSIESELSGEKALHSCLDYSLSNGHLVAERGGADGADHDVLVLEGGHEVGE